MKPKAGLKDFVAGNQLPPPVDDGLCQYSNAGNRCPLPARCWSTDKGLVTNAKLCVGHDTLRYDQGASAVFLDLALRGQVPFVPSSADALLARRMLDLGQRSSIAQCYGPKMVPWLEADPERGTPGGKWQRDYRQAVRETVKAVQMGATA